jgi:glycosyltransferase involved in cell wall biosynthesis
MPAIYDQCDILLNGTRVDNFPASLLEASASGLPVVSTTAGGIPFIYENAKNAILVDPGDWQGLAAGVDRLLKNQSSARQLAAEAVCLCRQCDWRNVRRQLYRSYGFDVPDARETAPAGLAPSGSAVLTAACSGVKPERHN